VNVLPQCIEFIFIILGELAIVLIGMVLVLFFGLKLSLHTEAIELFSMLYTMEIFSKNLLILD
jgi:hypothetical protein